MIDMTKLYANVERVERLVDDWHGDKTFQRPDAETGHALAQRMNEQTTIKAQDRWYFWVLGAGMEVVVIR